MLHHDDGDAIAALHARNAQFQVLTLIETAADAASAAPPSREIERAQALLAIAARLAAESLETLESLAQRLDRRPPAPPRAPDDDEDVPTWESLAPAGPIVASGRRCALTLVEDPAPGRAPRRRKGRNVKDGAGPVPDAVRSTGTK